MTGFIALKGTAILAERYKDRIDERFPSYLSRNALLFGTGKDSSDFERAKGIIKDHVKSFGEEFGEDSFAVEVKEGGFLTALYELAGQCSTGFELDLRAVPIRQETVEIAELLEVNPYHLYGEKCIVAIVPEGGALLSKLSDEGIEACLVGRTTDKKAHILHNDGTESHLNRPEPDELSRLGIETDAFNV